MNILKKLAVATAGAAFTILGVGATAQAISFTESGDAGETLDTAQIVNSQLPGTPLESITGFLSDDNADLFQIFLTGGQTFSATTQGGTVLDTQLFLFNADGFGVEANDDTTPSDPEADRIRQSTLLPGGLSPTTSGIYYLGISGTNNDPVSSRSFPSGFIFPDDPEGVVGPTGPGRESPLIGFENGSGANDGYTITLTGAQFSNAAAVPFELSPGLGSLILGAWGVLAYFKSVQKHKSLKSRVSKN